MKSNRGIKMVKIAVVLVVAVISIVSFAFSLSEKKINHIVNRYDGEDRYMGKYGRMTVEEQLDYMILKYSGSLEESRFESKEVDPDSGDSDYEAEEEADDRKAVMQILEEALYASAPDVSFTAPSDIKCRDIFSMVQDELQYKTGEHGILLEETSAMWKDTASGDISYHVEFQYSRSRGEIESIKNRTDDYADEVIADLDLSASSEYQKAVAINEYLCDSIEYPARQPYSDVSHTAYGAFIEHSAVCDGYARAAKLLCDRSGLECIIVTGKVKNGEGHAWNLVNIDGKWYQWDVCWNDGGYSREEYFLVTDDFMDRSRSWDEDRYPDVSETPYIR